MPGVATIILRKGLAAAWLSANPILASGEQGLETDTGRLKLGDGVTTWSNLRYWSPLTVRSASSSTTITRTDAPLLIYTGSGGDTFTLPEVVHGNHTRIKNCGSGTLTIQRSGADTIFTSAASQTSFTLAVGASVELAPIAANTWATL